MTHFRRNYINTKNDVVKAKTPGQKQYFQTANKNDICFAIGPAGTGKTYLAVALAVSALKRGIVKRIVLARPAVEAGESLGFLPGDFQDKIDPYLRPLYDALDDMMPSEKLKGYIEKNIVEIVYKTQYAIDARVDNIYTFDKILKNGGNVYALWVKKSKSKKWALMYIGQRKSKDIHTRLIDHLFKKHRKTGSQLLRIQEELMQKSHIGVTVIKVEPDVLRHSVEEFLIFSQREKGNCVWNKHS